MGLIDKVNKTLKIVIFSYQGISEDIDNSLGSGGNRFFKMNRC